ncbi:MAG: PEP-CTERM sorting domain-containing protein [Thiobacillus sp.]|nr:PEP-CTERM sorting domain-containing protein [Thiobacillus sp.]
MKFTMTKIAAGLLFAVTATGAQAASVVSWNLVDFNNDGLMSDFAFFSAPTGNSSNKFGAAVTSAPTPATGPCADGVCDPIAMNTGEIGTNVFSTGFNFGGTGVFAPKVANASGTGNIAADITGGTLTFSALDFAGVFGGQNFYLAPDNINAVNVETLTNLGGGNYGVVVRYVGTINNPASPFDNFAANWRLEGVMATVPEASTYGMMLAGLGLVGFAVRRRKLVA